MGSTTHAVAAAIVHKWILAGGHALFFAFVPRSAGRTRNAFLSIPIRFITRTWYAGNAIPKRFITRTVAIKTT